MIRRREFIKLLGGTAAAWPLAARAQQGERVRRIGFLGTTTAPAWASWTSPFVQRLRELGWIEGRTMTIEYRWAESRPERFLAIAAEFARLKVDVIFTAGAETTLAARRATSDIPIVFALANNPVSSGLVASLGRPGGNVTGLSTQGTDTVGKRLGLMGELIPNLRRWAVMFNAGFADAVMELSEMQAAAKLLGLEVAVLEIRRADDIAHSFDGIKGRADALYVCVDPLVLANRDRINRLALDTRLPTMHGFREYAAAGGLVSYGPNVPDLFRRSADFVNRIFRGAKPTDIPVEQPTKFDFVINLRTAKALGLTVPDTLLARADEVIE
jgi:putative tryptophan/tyrosine transport system substrate-binding protein